MSYYGKNTVKSYLSTQNLSRGWAPEAYDEPTYMGFKLEWEFNSDHPGNPWSQNLMPHGLLDQYYTGNATEYLININQGRRAEMLKEFITILKQLQNYSPWVFTEVGGLAEIYKLNPADGQRGKDKVINIKFQETLDNRVMYMLDLYRKIAFDAVNMKWILPDIMRFFKLNIYIAEIRSFHQPIKKSRASEKEDTVRKNKLEGKVLSQFGERGAQIASKWDDAKEKFQNTQWLPSQSELVKNGHFLNYLDANTSILKFELSECEFDINSMQFSAFETSTPNPGEAASGSFNIKVGHIREKNIYSLWDLIISDENSNVDSDTLKRITQNELSDIQSVNRGEAADPNAVYDASPYLKGMGRHLGDPNGVGNSITEKLLQDVITKGRTYGEDALTEAIAKPLLGNVYEGSLTQTASLLQGGLSGAITAIQQFTNNNANSGIGDNILGNTYENFSDAYVPPTPADKSLYQEFENQPLGGVKETDHAETATDKSKSGDLGNVGFSGPPSE